MTTAADQTQETQTEETTEQQVPDGQILHTLSDDDDDGDAGGDDNLDKRGRRSWAREAKQKLADYESKLQEMTQKLAQLENRPPVQQVYQAPPQTQQTQQDPVKQRLGEIRQEMQHLAMAMSSKDTPEAERQKMIDRSWALDEERISLAARAAQPRQQGPQMTYEEQVMRAEYPQIFQDAALYHAANAEFALLARAAGGPGGLPMMKEAATRVFQRMGIGQKKPAPSEAEKAKLSGTSGRAGASGTNGNQVAITKRDISDALAYFNGATGKYAGWNDKQKVDYWLKNVKLKGA